MDSCAVAGCCRGGWPVEFPSGMVGLWMCVCVHVCVCGIAQTSVL